MVPRKGLALTRLFRVKRGLSGLQFGDQLGNAVERLLIQDSTRNILEALNLDVDLIALTAHELAPHSRELMFMNGLRVICFRYPRHPDGARHRHCRVDRRIGGRKGRASPEIAGYIAPPLAPLTDEEQLALLVEALVCEDHRVDSFIVRRRLT